MEHTERNASDVGEQYHLKENETRGEQGEILVIVEKATMPRNWKKYQTLNTEMKKKCRQAKKE